ncbi:MAG: methylaspartate mutase subunit E [Acidobacteriia bacterium]|nr:methylaspartate mutase subunit E [Terriglobia bacterium]
MTVPRQHSILLGGVGGDCHSVGLTILRHSLMTSGYNVHYLGIQNNVRDFLQLCRLFNVVMISSMDGHSRYYLSEFPYLVKEQGEDKPLWYLGGNLSIGDNIPAIEPFLEMGFHRVFVKFADIETVLSFLRRDLEGVTAKPGGLALQAPPAAPADFTALTAALEDVRLSQDQFERTRKSVLEQWKTGRDATDLADNARFLAKQPSFPKMQGLSNHGKIPMLMHPRAGVATPDGQIRLFQTLNPAGARVLSYQVDSLTRLSDFGRAEQAMKDAETSKTPLLNGFPLINHGVPVLRRIISSFPVPLQTRHSAYRPELLAEISYAGGVTAFEGGSICYNIPYYKDYPLTESIPRWQYVDQLSGRYFDKFGIVIDREFFGVLTATLVPPSLAIASDLLESMLAVQQGVKSISLGYAEQGNRVQDVAAIRTMRRMAVDLMQNLGYKDVQINTVFHQYMAAFPNNRKLAEDLVYNSAISAGLAGATRVMVKTPAEAFGIPTVEDNAKALKLVRAGIMAAEMESVDEALVEAECEIIRRETQAILDSVILSGAGGVARGIVAGFEKGYIDIPFSPSIHNKGAVMTARDLDGAVRFLSFGNLQLDSELRDFHRYKMDERRRAEGIQRESQGYQLIEKDVMQVARGEYSGWPLSQGRTVELPPDYAA